VKGSRKEGQSLKLKGGKKQESGNTAEDKDDNIKVLSEEMISNEDKVKDQEYDSLTKDDSYNKDEPYDKDSDVNMSNIKPQVALEERGMSAQINNVNLYDLGAS
jgi:hypothetical protein